MSDSQVSEREFSEKDLTCPVTLQLFYNPVDLGCSKGEKPHLVEEATALEILQGVLHGRIPQCPECRAPIEGHSYTLRPDIKQKVDHYIAANADKKGERYQPEAGEQVRNKPRRYQPQTKKVWFWLRMLLILGGLAAGIYLATLVVPALITALIAAGLVPAWAMVLGIIAGLGIVYGITILSALDLFLYHLGWEIHILLALRSRRAELSQQDDSGLALFLFILAALAGVGLGIYAAVSVAPLLIASLIAAGLSYSVSVFMAVVSAFIFVLLFCCYLSPSIPLGINVKVIWQDNSLSTLSRIIYFVGLLGGIALGAYLVILLAPSLMAYLGTVSLATEITIAISLTIVMVAAKLSLAVTGLFISLVQYVHIKLTKPNKEEVEHELHAENPLLGKFLIARAFIMAEFAFFVPLNLRLQAATARINAAPRPPRPLPVGGEQQQEPRGHQADRPVPAAQLLPLRYKPAMCLMLLAGRDSSNPHYNADIVERAAQLEAWLSSPPPGRARSDVEAEALEFLNQPETRAAGTELF